MKSIFSYFTNMFAIFNKRMLLLVLVAILFPVVAKAGLATYYAKCTVTSTGNGLVYVGKRTTNNPSYTNETSVGNSSTAVQLGSSVELFGSEVSFYLYAKANDDYYFKGWTLQSNGTNVIEDSYIQPYTVTCNPEGTAENSPKPNYHYYAVFKHYVYGYANGRTAIVNEGDTYGEISLDGINWSNSVSENVGGEPVPKKHKGDAIEEGEDYITLTYHARFREGYDENTCYFIGWHDANGNFLSNSPDYNYKFYPSSDAEDKNNASCVPTIYAKFGKKAVYLNSATAQVVVADANGNYQEIPEEFRDYISEYIGGVYVHVNSDVEPDAADYQGSYTYGEGNLTTIKTNSNSGVYKYAYYAQAQTGYVFVGWANTLPNVGNEIIIEKAGSPITYEHFTDEVDDAKASAPSTLYAVFKQETFYYYNGAIADFTSNGEKGKITVTNTYYNEAKKEETPKTYSISTTSEAIDNSSSVYNTELNVTEYQYTYIAENTNPKTAFKGWSRSRLGGNYLTTNTTYVGTYTTISTTPESATTTPPVYAVFQSFWYKDPTVLLTTSSAGAGRVAFVYAQDEPMDNEWDWKNQIIGEALNQEPANEDKFNYSIWYKAEANFGSKFVGWANVDNPNQLIADDANNPYKVDYTITATDDEAPYVPARLYAVFQSVIDVVHKDRMIYYVDEHGDDNINDANIIVNFKQSDVLYATLIEDASNVNLFELSDKQRTTTGKSIELDASQGITQLVLSYKGKTPKAHIGRTAIIELSATYNDGNETGRVSVNVPITIEEKPTVTFLPTDGKASYTITHTDGRGIGYTMPIDAVDNIYVPIAQENMATFELNLEDLPDDGLKFSGWEMIVNDVATVFSHKEKCTYSFKESVSVRPVFLADNRAVFTILNDNLKREYFDLQLALNDAQKLYQEENQLQVVVFSNEDKVEGILQQGHYVVPNGVMLLIPGVGPKPVDVVKRKSKLSDRDVLITDPFLMKEADLDSEGKNTYVYRLKDDVQFSETATALGVLTVHDYTNVADAVNTSYNAPYPTCYRKLMVEDNTSITVMDGGSIELYSVLARSGQTYDAQPYRYGQIELGENCKIDLQNGATLYAFGYVTGANSSRVVAQSGAEVHEVFQYSDPRGGAGIAHLFLKREFYRVFPFSQFYIQNVTVPLEILAGATEYVTTSADVLSPYVIMTPLVISANNTNESGLFLLGDNTSLVKSYDAVLDRQKFVLKGNGADRSTISLGVIRIYMGDVSSGMGSLGDVAALIMNDLKNVTLNSSEYVLPMNNNMDLSLQSVKMSVNQEYAFMAGSSMTIDEGSVLELQSGGKLYLYDADENLLPANMRTDAKGNPAKDYEAYSGYFSASNEPLKPISATPNNSQYVKDDLGNVLFENNKPKHKRLAKDVKDTKWIVNGTVLVNSGAGLYTTAGGAQITSTQKGKVQFASTLADATAYQAKYSGSTSYMDLLDNEGFHYRAAYKVNSAKLQNANGTYVSTSQNTFTYDPAQGKWITSGEPKNLIGGEVLVTLPDYDNDLAGIQPLQTTISSSLGGVTSATVSWNGGASTNAAFTNDASGAHITVSYSPVNKAGEYEGLITINGGAYSQKIKVVEDYTPEFTLANSYTLGAYLGYDYQLPADIVPATENVAGLVIGDFLPEWTAKITGEHADEFTFVWGNGANLLTDAKIVFRPKTEGNKNATLSITCTYTDGASVEHTTTLAVPLSAISARLEPNPLAFASGIDSIFIGASAHGLFANVANGNTNPIVIQPATSEYYTIAGTGMSMTIQPMKIGTVTITATQDEDLVHGVAATSITKTITITDNIVWNWDNLYFGSENVNPITTLYTGWNLEVKDNHLNVIREFNSVSAEDGNYQVILESWPDGEATPVFTMTYNDGTGEKTQDFTSHVTRDPRHLSVYVNEARVYEAVTLNVSHINPIAPNSGDDYYVQFNSTEDEIAQWTFYFMGIPDKLSFNASGNNNWQIEESANGTNWTIAYTWSSISSSTEFELSLLPSTNYVRISYGTSSTSSMGVLSKIAVTELLSVKADVEKLYMPIIEPSSQKNVVFTYVSESDLALKTNSNVFTTNPTSLTGSNQSPFYQIKRVAVNSTATTEIKDGMLSVSGSSAAVPIRTYTYPQELPIQLASDELERYYFVTSESYNTSWSNDEATRSIIMRNAVADASPYVVFHFADAPAPGVISFNYANISDGASWTVQESEDGTVWYDLEVDADNEKAGQVMRKFLRPEKSRYVRVIYNSDYAGTVDITNMAILPTTSVVVNPAQLTVFSGQPEELSVIASNLQDIQFTFTPSSAFSINQVKDKDGNVANNGIQYFQGPGSHNGKAVISYNASAAVTYGTLTITTNYDANGTRLANPEVLATVELTGINRNLPKGPTGIMTGTGLKITNFKNANEGDEGYLREVNSKYAFDTNGKPLFDYVIIYGETKTTDGSGTVTAPSSVTGSNAQTPCYIYKKSGDQYVIEDETYLVENANSSRKSWRGAISIADTDLQLGNADPTPENLRVYITGFCPYASTGYTQSDEGVWYFEGDAGDKIDIYLEDCYIYSRYKSKRGNAFTRESGESYSGMVARGSGAVLLFANKTQKDGLTTSLDVTIHTRESNVLKSHYGCLFSSFVGRAFQISSPVHIYMQSENHYKNSYTTLTFDDKWPTDATDYTKYNRTNGFLSLQKQVNNAPSIDMGNKNTVVNFRGGHVELQNACISSDNYESSLAISYRTGVYGPSKFRFVLSYGIGTDGVEGTVNFYDGTTTVLPMEVPERFRQYYLMDDNGTTTSCLRTPKNTYVYGGSHCMMRACEAPTSKGGAPTDGISALGKFEYTIDKGWAENTTETENHVDCRLVTPTSFPDSCLTEYYKNKYTYGLKSVTPVDGKLNLWIPDLDCPQFEVKPEVDQQISFWKASMTLIEANYGVYSGSVGGDNVEIAMQDGEQKEQVQNLLYCQIDDNISGVISAQGNDQYVAPVLNPAPDGGYISIAPTTVGTELQNYVRNTGSYVIEDKVYYVTTIPQADVWMNFTAPFNVANIYVVEAYDEDLLEQAGVTRDEILVEQARHNANFAAFFGVAIALESKKTFNMIYNDYMGWVRHEYGPTAASKQGMKLLQHYYETYDAEGKYEGSNWRDADYYLYKNTANWILDATGNFTTEWGYIPVNITQQNGTTLLEQGETYSMMFPYCTGCWKYNEEDDYYYRNDWDYWSGKFIIFESTQGPHTIQGSDYVAPAKPAKGEWVFDVTVSGNEAKLMGNSTFADMSTTNNKIYTYAAEPMYESYNLVRRTATVEPTATFLLSNFSGSEMPARVSRAGELIYDKENTPTGNIPTVGGGNDLFITATVAGINIAVAEAQHVRVMSATGAIIYSGLVQTAVDVALPATGVYVITGENEVHKILH